MQRPEKHGEWPWGLQPEGYVPLKISVAKGLRRMHTPSGAVTLKTFPYSLNHSKSVCAGQYLC